MHHVGLEIVDLTDNPTGCFQLLNWLSQAWFGKRSKVNVGIHQFAVGLCQLGR